MKSSTKDKVEGKIHQVVGAVKEKVGTHRRDAAQRDEGTVEKTRGKIQSKIGDIEKVFET